MLAKIAIQNGMQVVYIPKEFQFASSDGDCEILRIGTSLLICPTPTQTLTNLMPRFAAFTPDFMANGRGEQGEQQRDSL